MDKQLSSDVAQLDDRHDLTRGYHNILIIIFDLIQHISSDTLRALELVSRGFHRLAIYIQRRVLRLDSTYKRAETSFNRLHFAHKNQLLPAFDYYTSVILKRGPA